jgi:hypothetical protein
MYKDVKRKVHRRGIENGERKDGRGANVKKGKNLLKN